MKKKEYSKDEIERYERIRLFEIDKAKKDIYQFNKELDFEKQKFLKNSKKIALIEASLKETEEVLMKLEHQTGYDLLVESDKSVLSKITDNISAEAVGSAIEFAGKVIPIPGVNKLVGTFGKNIKNLKNGK